MPEVREVVISADVASKLRLVHGLSARQVLRIVLDPENEPRWDIDPVHGGRVIVRGRTDEAHPRRVFVALRPIDVERGVWACITAFVPTREPYGA